MAAKKTTQKKKESTKAATGVVAPIMLRGKLLRTRGRTFQGIVIKKLPGRVTIQLERMVRVPKYERYEKRRTKLHARLPVEFEESVKVGSLIEIGETRPISKTIHFVVLRIIKGVGETNESSK